MMEKSSIQRELKLCYAILRKQNILVISPILSFIASILPSTTWHLGHTVNKNSNTMSPQHRNENTGKQDKEIFEGQVFLTEEELKPFYVEEKDILKIVLQKGSKT